MLDPRLGCVARHIRPGAVLADIGTDHAYLPIRMVETGVCPRAIASDLREGPADAARRHVQAAGLQERIEVRLGDGLSTLSAGEADDIVVAGMGGETIAAILDACPWIRDARLHLVLQPMTRPEDLRRYLFGAGFAIREEEIVPDGRHLYTVLDAVYTGGWLDAEEALCHIGRIPKGETVYLCRIRDRLRGQANGLSKASDAARRNEGVRLAVVADRLEAYMAGEWNPWPEEPKKGELL